MDTPHRRMLDLRPKGVAEVPALVWQAYPSARPDLPLHRHLGCWEFHLRQRGDQVFQVGEQTYRLVGGDLFATQPGEVHSTGGYPLGPGVMYCMLVRAPLPDRSFLGLKTTDTRSFLDRLSGIVHRQFRAVPAVKPLWDEVLHLHDRPDTFLVKPRLRLAVLRLLFAILDSSERCAAQLGLSQRIAQVVQTIRDHPEQDYRLADLAKKTHLSLARFKSRFKAEVGDSPWQFILQNRIEAAQRRLRNSRDPITQIAMDLGFVSSQYFAIVFKRMTGQTPRDYRNSAPVRTPSRRSDDGQG